MSTPDSDEPPVIEIQPDATYSLDVVAELTGISSQTILRYQEIGLISPVAAAEPDLNRFDDEAVRLLRRIEQLRTAFQMSEQGLKLTLELMSEVEQLRAGLRRRR